MLWCLQHLVGCLAKVLDSRDNTSPEVAAAGMVINTMGYIDGLGYELLADAVTKLRVGPAGTPKCRKVHSCSGVLLDACMRSSASTAAGHTAAVWQQVGGKLRAGLNACTAAAAAGALFWELQVLWCMRAMRMALVNQLRTCTWVLCFVVLQADVVLVMDQDRLYTQLTERLKVSVRSVCMHCVLAEGWCASALCLALRLRLWRARFKVSAQIAR